jgi:hypothetical protein
MLEENGGLRTWVLDDLQSALAGKPMPVEEIQPHRLDYLEIEGPLSGNRGSVTRVDRGTIEQFDATDLRIAVRVSGQWIRGTLELTRTSAASHGWQLSFALTHREESLSPR